MDILKNFEVDPQKTSGGVKVQVHEDGTCIIVRRSVNDFQRKDLRDRFTAMHAKYNTTELTQAQKDELTMQNVAHTILIGWEGVTENGQPVPFTPEKALEYFRKGPDFYALVVSTAQRLDLFLAHKQDELIKNS